MTQIQHLAFQSLCPNRWAGGQTYAYFIYPYTADYADKSFEFRISSATLESTPSLFTQFDGYHRYLAMLDHPLEVEIDGEVQEYPIHQIFEFESEQTLVSHSTGRDFNLMVRRNTNYHKLDQLIGKGQSSRAFIGVFALSAQTVSIDQSSWELKPYDLLLIENPLGHLIAFHSAKSYFLLEIDL